GRDPGREQQPVEVDALVTQRVALVHADHSGREPLHVLRCRERRPGQRVALGEGVDPVTDGATVVVEVEQYAVVLGRRRALRRGPFAADVRAQGVQALDESKVAVLPELEASGERQVAAAAFAGDDDASRVYAQVPGIGGDPLQTGHTIIKTRGERGHFGH